MFTPKFYFSDWCWWSKLGQRAEDVVARPWFYRGQLAGWRGGVSCMWCRWIPWIFRQRGLLLWHTSPGSPKTKLGYQNTPILPTTLREVFFEVQRLSSMRSDARWSDFLFKGNSLIPLTFVGVNWYVRVGIPYLKIKKCQWCWQARFRVAGINTGNRNRHKSHNPTYKRYFAEIDQSSKLSFLLFDHGSDSGLCQTWWEFPHHLGLRGIAWYGLHKPLALVVLTVLWNSNSSQNSTLLFPSIHTKRIPIDVRTKRLVTSATTGETPRKRSDPTIKRGKCSAKKHHKRNFKKSKMNPFAFWKFATWCMLDDSGPCCEVPDGQGPCSSSEMQAKGQRLKKPLPKS